MTAAVRHHGVMSTPGGNPSARAALQLQYPMSLGVHDDYADAQRAVDFLSDQDFPVQNCMIVGTDLKQVERVTGRLTWGRVLAGGAVSGAWLGAFVGLVLALFAEGAGTAASVLSTVIVGVVFGAVFAAAGYAVSRGQRDFTSVSQVVATRYEVLVEHSLAQQARDLLDGRGGPGRGQPA